MATPQTTFTLRYELRLCEVKDKIGYFHCYKKLVTKKEQNYES